MHTEQRFNNLDRFRLIAALLVIAIHTSPLVSFSSEADFFLTGILARIAVPFFLMVTGQFVVSGFLFPGSESPKAPFRYLRKMGILYVSAILLYLPLGIYAGHYTQLSILGIFRMLLFDGTFYHLWYFPACILGIMLLYGMHRFLKMKCNSLFFICGLLYILGLLGDSYYGLIADLPVIGDIYSALFLISSYTRNGLFLAPLFLLMGAWMGEKYPCSVTKCHKGKKSMPGFSLFCFALSLLAMTTEGFVLRYFSLQRHDSMYLLLPLTMFFLYQFLLQCKASPKHRIKPFSCCQNLRAVSTWIYLLHPAVIVVVRGIAKVLHATNLFVENSIVHYLAVTVLTIPAAIFAAISVRMLTARFSRKAPSRSRAWIELDMDALAQNVRFLRSRLREGCELMPVVKAEAYGHDSVLISRELNRLGIHSFCVACVTEGITLRKNGITGEILILGYTHPDQFPLLHRYHLTQTVVDYAYALLLNQYIESVQEKIHVHIGVDTGMHRLGERCENIDQICAIYKMPNLIVDGIFTHLSSDDTMNPQDIAFTEEQAASFNLLLQELCRCGCPHSKFHLLASYGVLNYPEFCGNYARIGIALYGVLSTKADTDMWVDFLHPVLTLKARVASIRTLYEGEAAGYGMGFTATRNMKIATLSIGYADGLPRMLSNGTGSVLIQGHRAPIIGKICMDQTIVDVSCIPDIKAGDIAILIGKSGEKSISASEIAEQCDTITNEILSRLGQRLEHISINNFK